MRADNDGEGGIMALIALVQGARLAAGARSGAGRARASSAPRCSTATASSPRRSRCCPRSRASRSVAPSLESLVVPIALGDADRALRGPALRHRRGRPPLRAGDGAVVRRDRRARAAPSVAEHPAILRALSPRLRRRVLRRRRPPRSSRSARRAGHHGRRGPLRRHGPLRRAADPPRLVLGRLPGADPQLPGPGRR